MYKKYFVFKNKVYTFALLDKICLSTSFNSNSMLVTSKWG